MKGTSDVKIDLDWTAICRKIDLFSSLTIFCTVLPFSAELFYLSLKFGCTFPFCHVHYTNMDPFYDVYKDAVNQVNYLSSYIKRLENNILQQGHIDDVNNNRQEVTETLEDLKESVLSIRNNPHIYSSISEKELKSREDKIDELERKFIAIDRGWSERQRNAADAATEEEPTQPTGLQQYDNFQQQELLREQDENLDSIHVSMQNLHNQAYTMGNELSDQGVLLRDLDDNIDKVRSKLQNGLKKVNWFLEKNRDKASDCCIVLLISALIFLLILLVIL